MQKLLRNRRWPIVATATAALGVLAVTSANADIMDLRITEVDRANNVIEITNTGGAFTVSLSDDPHTCHSFNYLSIPALAPGSNIAAGQVITYSYSGELEAETDLWIYRNTTFTNAANIVHGLQWGSGGHGRSTIAAAAGKWSDANHFAPTPPAGSSLRWDSRSNSPESWWVDETPSLGSADPPTTPGSVPSGLAWPSGSQNFEGLALGDDAEAITSWVPVNASVVPDDYIVRAVGDVRGSTPGPAGASGSTTWLRFKDQDSTNVQNRYYSNNITAPSDPTSYTFTYWVNVERAPLAGATTFPKFTIQHHDGAAFQNSWGIEFTNTGANLIVLGNGGTAGSTALFPYTGATVTGNWVRVDLTVNFLGNTVSADFNQSGTPVSLPINLTGNKAFFRLCHRGEGLGNSASLLLDDVSFSGQIVLAVEGWVAY